MTNISIHVEDQWASSTKKAAGDAVTLNRHESFIRVHKSQDFLILFTLFAWLLWPDEPEEQAGSIEDYPWVVSDL